MPQKLLTFYGARGWNEVDPQYCQTSVIRGYNELNKAINEFAEINPDITIQSVSYSHVEMPRSERLMFATVLYTGTFTKIPGQVEDYSSEKWARAVLEGVSTTIKIDL